MEKVSSGTAFGRGLVGPNQYGNSLESHSKESITGKGNQVNIPEPCLKRIHRVT